MYSHFYSLIQKLILKKNFYVDLIKLINKHKVSEIIDIGCADSSILEYINDEYLYSLLNYYSITTGNAGSLMVSIGGKIMGKLGKRGEVLDSIIISPDYFSN